MFRERSTPIDHPIDVNKLCQKYTVSTRRYHTYLVVYTFSSRFYLNEWMSRAWLVCMCSCVCRVLTWFTPDYYILLYLLRVFRACAWVSVCLSVRVEFWPGSHSDYYILLHRPTRVSVCLYFFFLFNNLARVCVCQRDAVQFRPFLRSKVLFLIIIIVLD